MISDGIKKKIALLPWIGQKVVIRHNKKSNSECHMRFFTSIVFRTKEQNKNLKNLIPFLSKNWILFFKHKLVDESLKYIFV